MALSQSETPLADPAPLRPHLSLDELRGPGRRAALLQVFERAIDAADGGHDACLLINSAIGLKDISPEGRGGAPDRAL